MFTDLRRACHARSAYPKTNPEQKNDAETEAETIDLVLKSLSLIKSE